MENTVRLEPMTVEMYHAYFREYENAPELFADSSRFVPYVYSPEQVDRYVQRQIALGRKCFAVMHGGEMVGELIIKNIEPGKSAVLSICMKNAACKGRGFGTRAERLAVDYVFRDLDIPVLCADTLLTNTRSQHVLEKLGFRLLRTEGDFKYYCIERPDRETPEHGDPQQTAARRIVPVTEENLDAAAEIHAAGWRASHAAVCAPDFVAAHTAARQREYLTRKLERGSRIFLLTDGEPAGLVSVTGNLIEDLYVHPGQQGRGYGSALLRHAIRECAGTPTLWLLETNEQARRFYKARGFRPTGKVNRDSGPLAEIEYALERPTAIRWIFFDLGSTLIDETDADERRIEEMTDGTGVTPEAYREKRLELMKQGLPGDPAAIAFFGLTKTPWHSELERPFPDAAPVLAELKRRGFRLGVVANQEPGTEQRLAAWDLLQYFDVVAPSAELGLAKPDPAIFRRALDRAGCAASEAVMVGDRLDNDIAPAKRLGFCTVRILRGLGVHHSPRSAAEEPEYTIRELAELLSLF